MEPFGVQPIVLLTFPQLQNLLRIEFARARRYSYPLSCVVLQVDAIDRLRDAHGSAIRDEILGRIVRLVQSQTRLSDSIASWNDRLALILPHTNLPGAKAVAARVRVALQAERFRAGGTELKVTASIGISSFAERGTIFYDSILKSAEAALAQAIAGGGDRIEATAPTSGPAAA